jgi:hypothetical protein
MALVLDFVVEPEAAYFVEVAKTLVRLAIYDFFNLYYICYYFVYLDAYPRPQMLRVLD